MIGRWANGAARGRSSGRLMRILGVPMAAIAPSSQCQLRTGGGSLNRLRVAYFTDNGHPRADGYAGG